jgi:hypothetical protein
VPPSPARTSLKLGVVHGLGVRQSCVRTRKPTNQHGRKSYSIALGTTTAWPPGTVDRNESRIRQRRRSRTPKSKYDETPNGDKLKGSRKERTIGVESVVRGSERESTGSETLGGLWIGGITGQGWGGDARRQSRRSPTCLQHPSCRPHTVARRNPPRPALPRCLGPGPCDPLPCDIERCQWLRLPEWPPSSCRRSHAVRDGEESESGRRVLPWRRHHSGLNLGIGTETDNGERKRGGGGGRASFELGGSHMLRQGKGMDLVVRLV